MKKMITLVLALCCTLAFAGCSPTTPAVTNSSSTAPSSESPSSQESEIPSAQEPEKEMTIEEIAENNSAVVYSIVDKKPMNFETSTISADGVNYQIGGMSIESVKYYESFQAGVDAVANAVVFDTFADITMAEDFLTNKAFVSLHNSKGDIYSSISSGTYYDEAADKFYIVFYSEEDIADYDTIILGGFAEKKNNGYGRFAFAITK